MAEYRGLNVIAITDHNTMKGYIELKKNPRLVVRAEKANLCLIPGMEISSISCDLLCLFIENEPVLKPNLDADEVIDKLRSDNDALIILAHPGRGDVCRSLVEKVDLVEVFNARSRVSSNLKAKTLGAKYHKQPICNSDAHFPWEIGVGRTIILNGDLSDAYDWQNLKKLIFYGRKVCVGKERNFMLSHILSTSVEIAKKFVIRIKEYGRP
jgi:predicted metal-dependent phosphoesterase TrpH